MSFKFGSSKIARKSLPAPAKKVLDSFVDSHPGVGVVSDLKPDGKLPDVDLLNVIDWRSVLTMGDVAIALVGHKVCGCGKCAGGLNSSVGGKKN